MKKISICLALILTACGNGYPIVYTQGYSYATANPTVNYPQNTMPYYYCYFNGMVQRRNTFHPRFNRSWIYAPFETCI